MLDMQALADLYFSNGVPVPYRLKNGGELLIYPILVKDYSTYERVNRLLTIKKDDIQDIEIVKMSYLQFLVDKVLKENDMLTQYFSLLIKLCLGYEMINCIVQDNKYILCLCNKNGTIEKQITHKEFNEISKIILHQNDANYDDREFSSDVEKAIADYYALAYKDTTAPTLEEKKAFVASKISKSFKELGMLTYREFDLIYSSCLNSELFMAQKLLQASEKYEIKENVEHPLFQKKTDILEKVFSVKTEDMVAKINQANI